MAMIDKDGVILQPELNLHPSVLQPVLSLRTTVLGFEDDDLMATTNNDGGIFNGNGSSQTRRAGAERVRAPRPHREPFPG